jgi:hypothetical protein
LVVEAAAAAAAAYEGEKNRKCEPLKKIGGHYRKG